MFEPDGRRVNDYRQDSSTDSKFAEELPVSNTTVAREKTEPTTAWLPRVLITEDRALHAVAAKPDAAQRSEKSERSSLTERKSSTLLERMYAAAKDRLVADAKAARIDSKFIEESLKKFEQVGAKYGPRRLIQQTLALENLREIINPKPGTKPYLSRSLRNEIFQTGLKNLSSPEDIRQGQHPTCNVTTVEVYAACRAPGEYARMLKEIALTGKYKTSEGRTVTPPRKALMPGEDESRFDLKNSDVNRRNYASQIVQMTLINGLYETGKISRNGVVRTDLRYVLDKSSWEDIGGGRKRKVGEDRLVDSAGRVHGSSKDGGPNLTVSDCKAAARMMLGKDMPYRNGPVSRDGGATWIRDIPTQEELLRAKAQGNFPMGVPTMGGMHVQTIHDVYKDRSGRLFVKLDNQHEAKKDGWVSYDDLVRTMSTRGHEAVPSIKRWQHPSRLRTG